MNPSLTTFIPFFLWSNDNHAKNMAAMMVESVNRNACVKLSLLHCNKVLTPKNCLDRSTEKKLIFQIFLGFFFK